VQLLWNKVNEHNNSAVIKVNKKIAARLKRQINYRLLTSNFQEWINRGKLAPSPDRKPYFSGLVPNFRLDVYHTLQEIDRFLTEVSKRGNVKVFDIGITHEGRPIKAVEILNNANDDRYVWIDGCTHAREWVTVSTALFIIEQAIISRIQTNFLIVPIINADGYEYTWSVDRLWRKNRRLPPLQKHFAREECFGVDLNRNYDANFGGEGSSDDPCSHVFQGVSPFSEPETAAIAKIIWKMRNKIKLFLSLHSFHQLWSCPFAFTKAASPHFTEHVDMLTAIRDSILKTTGEIYRIGPLSTELYVGSGFSLDWTYGKAGIIHSYLAELRDKGTHGFLLPAEQIIPTAIETWAAVTTAICKIFRVNC
ncbi:carboxypeptidase A2-like protein, partial [Leptotrombidium deliense]